LLLANDIDPDMLEALPEDMRAEILATIKKPEEPNTCGIPNDFIRA
jgi:hypothetical protein